MRAVFIIFCELGSVDPDGARFDGYRDEFQSNWDYLRQLWDEALEDEPVPPAPVQSFSRNDDPWASTDPGYSDEPPF